MRFKPRMRRLLEVIFAALLFGSQTVLNAGMAISIMSIPLLPLMTTYLIGLGYSSWSSWTYVVYNELWAMFICSSFIVGRIVALIGVVVFLIAAGQWVRNHRKKVGLFKTGLYAKVRHPQFTGIIITTLGLTIMTLTLKTSIITSHGKFNFNVPIQVGLWFLQVLGYIAIAKYEDWRLTKKFGPEHAEYKQNVPFLYPLKNPKKTPELPFTIIITLTICIILLLLPYDLIRIYSAKLYTY